ncbi:MAG: ceramidase domain-containing protein [Myxococcota bacterium]|nr:ceramidase domain-containing protein [Myxococcota bacterium]
MATAGGRYTDVMFERRQVGVPLLVIAMVVVTCVWIGGRADDEVASRTPATCRARGCYCEAVAVAGVRQPINAWSSLAPALAGACVLALALGRRPAGSSRLARSRTPGVLLALAASGIAVFSFHYHATLTWVGEWLDGVALYLLAGFPIAGAIVHPTGRAGWRFAAVYVAVAAAPAGASWLVPALRKPAFLALAAISIAVVLARRSRTNGTGDRWLALAVGSFAIAMVAWILDATRTVCEPTSSLHLHALWHLLSAPTIIALDRHAAADRAIGALAPTR